jgi:hypothetical protein
MNELLSRHPIDPDDLDAFLLLIEEGIVDERFRQRLEWNSYQAAIQDVMAELSKDHIRKYFPAAA